MPTFEEAQRQYDNMLPNEKEEHNHVVIEHGCFSILIELMDRTRLDLDLDHYQNKIDSGELY